MQSRTFSGRTPVSSGFQQLSAKHKIKTELNKIPFDSGSTSLTCNNRRLSVIQELNGCAGQDHALVL